MDDEADFERIAGWIQLRFGDEWFVTGEHCQEC